MTGFRLFLAAVLAVMVSACSKPAENHGMVLNRGNGGEPISLDPQHIQGTWESNIIKDLLVGLTTEDAQGHPSPGAAESWDVSTDGKTWTFHMRDHMWSDGVPVTAHDFVYAWRRLQDPKTAAYYAYNMWIVKNAQAIAAGKMQTSSLGVNAPDDKTLIVQLEHPAPYFPELLMHQTAFPVPEHTVEKLGDAWARNGNYVSNGPYMLKDWLPNDHVTLVKNPKFYDAAHVRIDRVNYIPSVDTQAGLKRIRSGELDTQNPIPAMEIRWMRKNIPDALHLTPYLGINYVLMNMRRAPFKDVRVRHAINLAYNREHVAGKLMNLGEPPAYSMLPPGVANFPGGVELDFKITPYDQRVVEAQALMRAAGYGPTRHLHASYNTSTDPDSKRVAAAVQDMMRAIYIDLEIVPSDVQIHFQTLRNHNFDIAAAAWIADFNDATNFLDLLRSDSGNNYGGYKNPAYDALLNKAQQEPDGQKRGELLAQAERMALADYAWVPVLYRVTRDIVQPYVKGWVATPSNFHPTRYLWIEGRPQ